VTDSSSVCHIVRADYSNPLHAHAIIALLDEYASGSSGGGEPLPQQVKAGLIPALQRTSCALTLLAFAGDEPIGLINAFETLSTFRAMPLLNIHDIAVTASWRRRGVARELMRELENIARERGCCKLTLEVLENNLNAQALYRELGFEGYQLREEFGRALFWQKLMGDVSMRNL
jgi:ribosomal protein S18 acetylase RimI-like enzyme